MLKLLFAASLLLAPVQAVPQTTVPTDLVARAKFPHDDPQQVDALALINKAINASIQYQDDRSHYGMDELWVMFPADHKGDCEDYALTKMGVLSEAQFPIVTNARIVGVMVHHDGTEDGHAVLALKLPSGAVMFLDNNNAEPMTKAELERQGYQFVDWRLS
jgi:predicted transglutaminase-like cysteine proteinase